jgi:hypothetical protein
MEIYYFLSGLQIAVIAVLLYQYRYMLASIKANINNIKSISDGYEILRDNQSNILKKMTEDNYADASQMNSNLSALKTQIDATRSDLESLIKQHNNLKKKTDNDKLELIQNFRAGVQQMTDQRGY